MSAQGVVVNVTRNLRGGGNGLTLVVAVALHWVKSLKVLKLHRKKWLNFTVGAFHLSGALEQSAVPRTKRRSARSPVCAVASVPT